MAADLISTSLDTTRLPLTVLAQLTSTALDTTRLPLTVLAQLTSTALDTTRFPRAMYTFLVLGDATVLQFGLIHLKVLCNAARCRQVVNH
jgi:hypothetical protein